MPKIYPPVGRCIYCGAARYVPKHKDPPHDEHIIPSGLNGDMVLPQASCQACERAINPWETILLKHALYAARIHLGFKSRKPKDRAKALPFFIPETEAQISIDVEDAPVVLQLPFLPYCRALGGNVNPHGVWMYRFTEPDFDLLWKKYGVRGSLALVRFDTWTLYRTLAKIAHSFACAELGVDGFEPYLVRYILSTPDDDQSDAYRFVGGIPVPVMPHSDALHQILIENPHPAHWEHVVVRVQMFAKYGGPVYRIAAGRRLNPKQPAENDLVPQAVVHNVGWLPEGSPQFDSKKRMWWADGDLTPTEALPVIPRYVRAQTKHKSTFLATSVTPAQVQMNRVLSETRRPYGGDQMPMEEKILRNAEELHRAALSLERDISIGGGFDEHLFRPMTLLLGLSLELYLKFLILTQTHIEPPDHDDIEKLFNLLPLEVQGLVKDHWNKPHKAEAEVRAEIEKVSGKVYPSFEEILQQASSAIRETRYVHAYGTKTSHWPSFNGSCRAVIRQLHPEYIALILPLPIGREEPMPMGGGPRRDPYAAEKA